MTALLVPLVTGAAVAYWICGPIMVAAAVAMILSRKAVYSALYLALVMVNLAIIYASQDAPFLFVVQIIVYTGAVMMLFLFVVMLIGVDTRGTLVERVKGHTVTSVIAGIGGFILLAIAIGRGLVGPAIGVEAANQTYGGNVQGLAALLFGRYVLAFEATSALLITAASEPWCSRTSKGSRRSSTRPREPRPESRSTRPRVSTRVHGPARACTRVTTRSPRPRFFRTARSLQIPCPRCWCSGAGWLTR